TTLALRLALLRELSDVVMVETVVNPVFDRGYFREISVLSSDGRTLLRKVLPPAPGDVPEWFIALLPIEAPGAQSLISSGWRELGRVLVRGQPNFAYQQLWHAGLQALVLLLGAYLLAIAATVAFLAMLLRPLREIEQAAVAIGERNFRTITFMPRARELARVVTAMNDMSGRIRLMLAEESARAETLRRDAFIDPVTGLYNRRGFQRQLQSLIKSKGDVYSGALVLLEIGKFGEFNAAAGYQRGDEVLAVLGGTLAKACEGRLAVCGRLGGAGFSFAVLNIGGPDLHALVAEVCRQFESALADQGAADKLHYQCGGTRSDGALPEFSALMSAADHALQRAREQGENRHEIEAFDPAVAEGSQTWRVRIEQALGERRFALFAQSAFGLPGRAPVHSEVTVRMLAGDGEPIAAAQFLPMAARHGLIARLDCVVVEKLLDFMSGGAAAAPVMALNISAHTVADPEATRRILGLLDARKNLAGRLVFEMTEFGAMHEWKLAQRFSEDVRRRGARFALDNFGLLQESLMLVNALRPNYIKLSAGYSRELARSADCRFLVASLVKIARTLDIAIFAQAVEDEALLPLLLELEFAGYQGYATELPVRIA
ncbi:MAG: bifunctional diguanylate cyclase/phosphodiesterase, partial [Betaproteobacteria bacterium]